MDADHVDVYPLAIHFAEPALDRRGVHGHRPTAQIGHRTIDLRQILDERPGLLNEDVAVNVDGPDRLAANRHPPPAARRLSRQRCRPHELLASAEQEPTAGGSRRTKESASINRHGGSIIPSSVHGETARFL
jgi:hypothetical protein